MAKEIEVSFSHKDFKNSCYTPKTERWNKVKVGSNLRLITDAECMIRYKTDFKNSPILRNNWRKSTIIKYLQDRGNIKVTRLILEKIITAPYEQTNIFFPIVDGSRIEIPLEVLAIDGIENFSEIIKIEDTAEDVKYPLTITKKDPKIIEEMISKVDRETFKKILSLGINTDRTKNVIACDLAVDNYLNKWAESKYEFYILLGKELSVTKKVKLTLTDKEVDERMNNFRKQFPIYSPILNLFNSSDFLENKCVPNAILETYAKDYYKQGMKLSKFISKYFKDDKLDIELSKVLQSRNEDAILNVSINPCDYLMMSTNQHSWKSCQNLIDGCYRSAPYSLMLDESTVVAFVDNGKIFEYKDMFGLEFNYKSFRCRELVHIDKSTSSVGFNKYYPPASQVIKVDIRNMVEDILSEFHGISDTWKLNKINTTNFQNHNGNYHYHDPIQSNIVHETMKHEDIQIYYNIGSLIAYSLLTGEEISTQRTAQRDGFYVVE